MIVLQLNKDQISVAEEVASRGGRTPSKMVNCVHLKITHRTILLWKFLRTLAETV